MFSLYPSYISAHGDIRLIKSVGSSSDAQGLVEMYLDDQWTMVCNNGWDLEDASIVCKQLGFQSAGSVMPLSPDGSSDGPFVDAVDCPSSVTSLVSCHYTLLGEDQRCPGDTYAGVECIDPSKIMFKIFTLMPKLWNVEMHHCNCSKW